ncbi:MAG: hypothetical protein EOP48_05365, partial [Sphingobacteriales bacterium]
MKYYVSEEEVFIHFEQRSVDTYHIALSNHVRNHFAAGYYDDDQTVRQIIENYYEWAAEEFRGIILQNNDWQFVSCLFAYHESSILLWQRVLQEEDLSLQFEIEEEVLSLNRRIFRLALEQMCDIDYTHCSKVSRQLFDNYDRIIEDLLYIGTELYHAGSFLAELRMRPNSLRAIIEPEGLIHIRRKGVADSIFTKLFIAMNEDFARGIVDAEGVVELKNEIKMCFGIDYDFASSIIVQTKKHLNPQNWEFQTIEPRILVQNLVNNGVSAENAENFYGGLVINKENKLSIK